MNIICQDVKLPLDFNYFSDETTRETVERQAEWPEVTLIFMHFLFIENKYFDSHLTTTNVKN